MNDIITAVIQHNAADKLYSVPPELTHRYEQDWVLFIRKYALRYGVLPTVERLQKQFPSFVPILSIDPLEDVIEQFIASRQHSFLSRLANDILDAPLDVQRERLAEAQKIANITATGFDTIKEYNPDRYVSRGKTWDFPFDAIQHATGGISEGELTYLYAGAKAGKSTITLWMVKHWMEQGARVLFVSTEMATSFVFVKVDAMLAGFDPLSLRINPNAKEILARHADTIKRKRAELAGDLIVYKKHLFKPAEIAEQAKAQSADIVVIDGVYKLLPDSGGSSGSDWGTLTTISNTLNRHALELGIPYVATTQANRTGEVGRTIAFQQDGAFVLKLEREGAPNERILQLDFNRYGPLDFNRLSIDHETSQVETVE